MFRFRFLIINVFLMAVVFAQTSLIPSKTISYSLLSEKYNGVGESARPVWDTIVRIPEAAWIRLRFGKVNLGNGSYIQIKSLLDSSTQHLNAKTLLEWYNTSAFFNGNAVEVKLFVEPNDVDIYTEINEVIAGEYLEKATGIESICGIDDDRVRSFNNAVGRIIQVGCTGWIVSNGLHVTAGHCIGSGTSVLQFNVPNSLPDGTIQHPPAKDQYSIDQQSIVYQNGGLGNDWAVFKVFNNSETGLQPIEAYKVSFSVAQGLTSNKFRVTGYGVDGPAPYFGSSSPRNSDSQTQQTHVGSNINSSGTIIRHTADTQPGNSGSPIIDENTGSAVGVHTNGGCGSTGGSNSGTSTYNSNFWSALNKKIVVTLDQKLSDGSRLINTDIGIWNGVSFSEIKITEQPPKMDFTVGMREVLRGHQQIVSNEKYRVWERNQVEQLDTVENHRGFTILLDDQNLTSRFHPTHPATMQAQLIDGGSPGGYVEFKDPWLIDYPDSNYGGAMRNRGMNDALWYSKTSPFTPNTNPSGPGSEYKGVFLNQTPDPQNPNAPYYSVRAPQEQVIGSYKG